MVNHYIMAENDNDSGVKNMHTYCYIYAYKIIDNIMLHMPHSMKYIKL